MLTRVSWRVLDYLSGTQAWIDAERADVIGPAAPVSLRLMHKIQGARPRKDGSVRVLLTNGERADLSVFAEGMETVSRNSLPDSESMADLNAARSLLRQLVQEVS